MSHPAAQRSSDGRPRLSCLLGRSVSLPCQGPHCPAAPDLALCTSPGHSASNSTLSFLDSPQPSLLYLHPSGSTLKAPSSPHPHPSKANFLKEESHTNTDVLTTHEPQPSQLPAPPFSSFLTLPSPQASGTQNLPGGLLLFNGPHDLPCWPQSLSRPLVCLSYPCHNFSPSPRQLHPGGGSQVLPLRLAC